jgi:hypothetical protein
MIRCTEATVDPAPIEQGHFRDTKLSCIRYRRRSGRYIVEAKTRQCQGTQRISLLGYNATQEALIDILPPQKWYLQGKDKEMSRDLRFQ